MLPQTSGAAGHRPKTSDLTRPSMEALGGQGQRLRRWPTSRLRSTSPEWTYVRQPQTRDLVQKRCSERPEISVGDEPFAVLLGVKT